MSPLQGLTEFMGILTQGVALGCHIAPFQGE
jgi:hypothetical protein